MTDNDILDLTRLREAFEDDEAGIVELLEMALATGEKHVARLRQALSDRDAEGAARAAHGIKGSAGNIGATTVYELAVELDQRARLGNLEGARERIDAIGAAYAQVADEVRTYRAQLG